MSPSRLTPSPSATPSSGGAVNVSLKLSKLVKGRDPQIPYLVGREVRGGAARGALLGDPRQAARRIARHVVRSPARQHVAVAEIDE